MHYAFVRVGQVFNDVASNTTHYPNYGVPGSTGIFYAPNTAYCIDLTGGDASWRTPIQLWQCNGLVNQVTCVCTRAS